ncbi:MAG: glycosyltransferase family 39 protein [Candidatus Omnitrophota bacterium]
MKNKNLKYLLILAILSYFYFIFGNSLISLTNPDEVFYTLTAKEMVKHNTWLVPYIFDQPQFEKPIFTYLLIRAGFLLFGMTNFAARFFPALFGVFGVLAVYALSMLGFKNKKKAFISSLVIMSSGLYIGLSRTVFTDMIFTVLILLSILSFFWGYSQRAKKDIGIILFFIFAGFAVLTKGPLGALIPLLVIGAFLSIKKEIKFLFCKSFVWGILIFALISLPWYLLMIKKFGTTFTQEFFYNDHIRRLFEAEHLSNDTWYFYPAYMILCMFPWSLFVAVALVFLFKNCKLANPMYLFLACWISVVLVVFQFAHSKLISYIFPLFPALALLAGDFIYNIVVNENKNRQFFRVSLASLFIFFLIAIGLAAASNKFSVYLSNKAPFYICVGLFFILLLAALNFILRYKFFKVIYLFAALVPVFLSAIPFVKNDIEPYLSSKQACDYLMSNYKVTNTILASKFFARGVRFYTGRDLVVYGPNFFSPHPLTFLDIDSLVLDFLHKQKVTYCILKKSSLKDMQRITNYGKLNFQVLKVFGDEYIVKVE